MELLLRWTILWMSVTNNVNNFGATHYSKANALLWSDLSKRQKSGAQPAGQNEEFPGSLLPGGPGRGKGSRSLGFTLGFRGPPARSSGEERLLRIILKARFCGHFSRPASVG